MILMRLGLGLLEFWMNLKAGLLLKTSCVSSHAATLRYSPTPVGNTRDVRGALCHESLQIDLQSFLEWFQSRWHHPPSSVVIWSLT